MTALLRRLERKLSLKSVSKETCKVELKPTQQSCRDITREKSFWDNAVLS